MKSYVAYTILCEEASSASLGHQNRPFYGASWILARSTLFAFIMCMQHFLSEQSSTLSAYPRSLVPCLSPIYVLLRLLSIGLFEAISDLLDQMSWSWPFRFCYTFQYTTEYSLYYFKWEKWVILPVIGMLAIEVPRKQNLKTAFNAILQWNMCSVLGINRMLSVNNGQFVTEADGNIVAFGIGPPRE